jgi:hypothetical protein
MPRYSSPFHPLSHKGSDFVEMPRAEIMGIDADIHGKGSRCVREVPMRMSLQVPCSMMGAIPDAHGIVTDHDGLPCMEISARLLSQENSSVSLRICLS